MAKTYDLERSKTTGGWTWECNDGSGSGTAATKSDARADARAKCGAKVTLTPPDIDAHIVRGHLATFTVSNLDNERVTFSAGEISEQAFFYFCGLECAEPDRLTPAEKAITILKIWGIYRGGLTEERIRKLHFLDQNQFSKLVKKQFAGLKILVNDDGTVKWRFPKESK
jgi:hypothetical protein